MLESQLNEAASAYQMLLDDVGLKEVKLEKYTAKLKEMNIGADKDHLIQEKVQENSWKFLSLKIK